MAPKPTATTVQPTTRRRRTTTKTTTEKTTQKITTTNAPVYKNITSEEFVVDLSIETTVAPEPLAQPVVGNDAMGSNIIPEYTKSAYGYDYQSKGKLPSKYFLRFLWAKN